MEPDHAGARLEDPGHIARVLHVVGEVRLFRGDEVAQVGLHDSLADGLGRLLGDYRADRDRE